MKALPEAGSLSHQQAMDQKKACDTCCDLNPLFPAEPSATKEIDIFRGNRYIVLSETFGAYRTSADLGCPICDLLASVFDKFWPGQTRDAQTHIRLEENAPPALWALQYGLPRVTLYTSTRLGKCAPSALNVYGP